LKLNDQRPLALNNPCPGVNDSPLLSVSLTVPAGQAAFATPHKIAKSSEISPNHRVCILLDFMGAIKL
jgi:hypothetical protein